MQRPPDAVSGVARDVGRVCSAVFSVDDGSCGVDDCFAVVADRLFQPEKGIVAMDVAGWFDGFGGVFAVYCGG